MIPFSKNDRAYCMAAGLTVLRAGQLYCVAETHMYANGEQTLRLVGHGKDWFNASRFVRVADPLPRKWPPAK